MPSHAAPSKIGWITAVTPRYLLRPSVLILIAANLLPLYGVLRWGWDLYSLLVLYWLETGVIGLLAMTEMTIAARWAALFLVPFFVIHFGGFMFGHLVFLTVMFGPGGADTPFGLPQYLLATISEHGLWLALIALGVSHGLSFVFHVLRPIWRRGTNARSPSRQPAQQGNPQDVMGATYGRVVVLHLTIIFGAALTAVFNTKLAAFALLVALKTVVDVATHVRRNFESVPADR